MFHAARARNYDAALCMYHDQALIPLKALHFEDGVNITLGLPIVRTAPDHGTAFDIAGQDRADPRPMAAAIRMAAECAATAPPRRERAARAAARRHRPPRAQASKALGQNFILDRQLLARIAAFPARSKAPRSMRSARPRRPDPRAARCRRVGRRGRARPALHPALAELEAEFPGGCGHRRRRAEDRRAREVGDGAHVVANLPYNVGTALLLRWLSGPGRRGGVADPDVPARSRRADRREPGSEHYGRLSVAAQWRSTPGSRWRCTARVRAAAQGRLGGRPYRPAAEPEGVDPAVLERLTEAAFGQRRKMLRRA
jgi:hypothetical protein